MSDQIQIEARPRARSGTGLVRRLRKEGDVPAVIYGAGGENLNIAIKHDLVINNLDNEAFTNAIVEITTDGVTEQAVLRDIQMHAFKPKVLHLDFMRIDAKNKLTLSLPVHLVNVEDCIGVKNSGGILSTLINELDVVCLPKDLPENIEIDVSKLDINESIHLSEVTIAKGVEFALLNQEQDQAIVAVLAPKVVSNEDESSEEEGEVTEAEESSES